MKNLISKIIKLEKIYSSKEKKSFLLKLENQENNSFNQNNFYLNFQNYQKYKPQLFQIYSFVIYQNKNGFYQIKEINTPTPECICQNCFLCFFKQFYQKQEQLKTGYLTLNGLEINHYENKKDFQVWKQQPRNPVQYGWTNLNLWSLRNN